MSTGAYIVSSVGLMILGAAFLQLAKTNTTEELYLQALEYGFALAFLVVAAGLMVIVTI